MSYIQNTIHLLTQAALAGLRAECTCSMDEEMEMLTLAGSSHPSEHKWGRYAYQTHPSNSFTKSSSIKRVERGQNSAVEDLST